MQTKIKSTKQPFTEFLLLLLCHLSCVVFIGSVESAEFIKCLKQMLYKVGLGFHATVYLNIAEWTPVMQSSGSLSLVYV